MIRSLLFASCLCLAAASASAQDIADIAAYLSSLK